MWDPEKTKLQTPPAAGWSVTKIQSVHTALLSVSTSSNCNIIWDACLFLRCHFQPPQRLNPNGFLFVWLPHHIGAMLLWSAVHCGYNPPPPLTCCWRVKGAINNHCALVVHSCVNSCSMACITLCTLKHAYTHTHIHAHTHTAYWINQYSCLCIICSNVELLYMDMTR